MIKGLQAATAAESADIDAGVRIGDGVEIGACTTVDRGALDHTVIEDGAIIDNLVQSAEEALSHADLACNMAKQQGRNRAKLYNPADSDKAGMAADMGWAARVREMLEHDLSHAFSRSALARPGLELQDRLFVILFRVVGFADPVGGIHGQVMIRVTLEERFHRLAPGSEIPGFTDHFQGPIV